MFGEMKVIQAIGNIICNDVREHICLQDAVGPLTEAHFNKKQLEVGSTIVFF